MLGFSVSNFFIDKIDFRALLMEDGQTGIFLIWSLDVEPFGRKEELGYKYGGLKLYPPMLLLDPKMVVLLLCKFVDPSFEMSGSVVYKERSNKLSH